MIKKYIKMMEELKALGEQILEADETTGFEPWYDELDCMDDHLSISLGLLKDATAE